MPRPAPPAVDWDRIVAFYVEGAGYVDKSDVRAVLATEGDAMTRDEKLRCDVAWLLWCLDQGYEDESDRAIVTNWLLLDPATLHPNDVARRPHLLAMADEVIALVRAAGQGHPQARDDA